MLGETVLEMAMRHVHQGELMLARQRALIDRMDLHSHDSTKARALLETFEEAQAEHRTHLNRLLLEG